MRQTIAPEDRKALARAGIPSNGAVHAAADRARHFGPYHNLPGSLQDLSVETPAASAPSKDLRKAYKQALVRNHPDRGGDPEIFKQLSSKQLSGYDGDPEGFWLVEATVKEAVLQEAEKEHRDLKQAERLLLEAAQMTTALESAAVAQSAADKKAQVAYKKAAKERWAKSPLVRTPAPKPPVRRRFIPGAAAAAPGGGWFATPADALQSAAAPPLKPLPRPPKPMALPAPSAEAAPRSKQAPRFLALAEPKNPKPKMLKVGQPRGVAKQPEKATRGPPQSEFRASLIY